MSRRARIAIAAALLVAACGGKKDEPERKQAAPPEQDSPSAPDFGGLGMMSSLLAARPDEPGPYEEPRQSEGFSDDKPHRAVIELGGAIVELGSMSLLSGLSGTELREVQTRLRALAADDKVTGLIVRFEELDIEPAVAEELRASLIAFKTARGGKRRVECHTEAAGNFTYYVMTACDSIALAPGGEISISGVAMMPVHLKRLLDKIGVRGDFLHVGAFKGAAEPLTRDQPSKEMVETLGAILDDAYATLVDGIAEGRGLDAAAVRSLIDTAMFHGEAALEAKLVDRIGVFEEVRGTEPWQTVKISDDGPPDMAKLMEMIGLSRKPRPSQPHIALVYAVGSVVDGKAGGTAGARSEIASRPLSAALRVLGADDAVKAIVVRVSSGGGSALSSEIIWQAMREVSAKKPVIVSMGGVAASGGYYISAGGSRIFADRNTLTGSIGVVGGKLVVGQALKEIGIDTYPMARGKRATMFSVAGAWSPDERAAVQSMMEAVYETFLSRVAQARGKSRDQVHAIAQGRVWTGADAKEKGLVDEIGGLEQALAAARQQGKIEEDVELEVYPPNPTLLDLLASMGESFPVARAGLLAEIGAALGPAGQRAVAAALAQILSFRDTPVQATLILPLVLR